jgi:uncharacterized sodium:solute symporter family permease YidK
LTIFTFVFFTVLVAVITLYLTRRDDHKSITGYFLAGRNLSWPLVAGSLLLTNLCFSWQILILIKTRIYLQNYIEKI